MAVNLALYRPTLSLNKQFVSLTLPGLPEDQDPLLSYCKEKKLHALCEKLLTNTPLTWLEYQSLYAELSAVIVPEALLPNELHPIINDIHESTLRHPYQQADIVWQTPDNFMQLLNENNDIVEVPRPNHGLSHTVRGAAYIPRIIQYVKTHLDPAYIAAFENYTPRRIRLLQLAALFRVVGRKDETGLLTDVPGARKIYESYRAASANAFADYCKVRLPHWKISDAEIFRYKQLIYNMGNPAIFQQDITWLFHQNSALTVSETGFLLDNFFLHLAHTLDSYRYRDNAHEILQALHLKQICVPTKNEADDFEELLQFPIHLLAAMGDRIIMGKHKVPLFARDYDAEKFPQNNCDPQSAIAIVNAFSRPECNAPLLAGPRNRSEATIDFQNLVNDLLNPAVEVKIQLNYLKEIEVLTSHHENNAKMHYNVTHILWGQPDFEQLIFTAEALKEYEKQVNSNKIHLKAVLDNPNDTPSESDFLKQDPLLRHAHLSYAEKLAINQYTHDENYSYINFLLRYGRLSTEWKLPIPDLLNIIQDVLLISAIASFALSKIPAEEMLPLGPTQISSRTEVEGNNDDIMQEREENIEKNMPTRQLGFFSTSERAAIYESCFPFVMWIKQPKSINPQGKKIKELAHKEHQKEAEVLFPPNTEFFYRYEGGGALLQGTPVRSLNTTSSRPYSRRVMAIRNQLIEVYHCLSAVKCSNEKGYEALQALVMLFAEVPEGFRYEITKSEESEIFTKLIYEAQSLADYFAAAKLTHFPDVTPKLRSIAAAASIKINKIVYPDSMGPFYYALREGDVAAIQPLVDRGYNINRINSRGESIIFYAVYKKMQPLVIAMIEAGADVNKINVKGQSLLEKASHDEDVFSTILNAESLNVSCIDLLNNWFELIHLKLFIQYRPAFLRAAFTNLMQSAKDKDSFKTKNLLASTILAAIIVGSPLANDLFQLWNDFIKSSLNEYWLQMFLQVGRDVDNSLRNMINSNFALQNQTESFLEYLFSDPSVTNEQILKLLCLIDVKTVIKKIFTARGLSVTPFALFVLNKINEKAGQKLLGLLYYVAYKFMREELIRFITQEALQLRIRKAILIAAINNNHHSIVEAVKLSGLKLDARDIALFNPEMLSPWQRNHIAPLFEMYNEEIQAAIKEDLARQPILSQEVMIARLQFAEAIKDQALLEKLFTQRKVADVPLVHILLNATPMLLNAFLISYPDEVNTRNAQGETPLNVAISQLLIRRITVLLSCKADLFLEDAPSPFMQLMNLSGQQKDDMMQALIMLYSEARATPGLTQKFLAFLQVADVKLKKCIHEIANELQDKQVLDMLNGAPYAAHRP